MASPDNPAMPGQGSTENPTLPDQGFPSTQYAPFRDAHCEGNRYAIVNHCSLYGATYINDVVDELLRKASTESTRWIPVRSAEEIPDGQQAALQWREYESLDWKPAFEGSGCLVDGYCNRKGLIRKAHMAKLVNHYVSKRPNSCLRNYFPKTVHVAIDARRDWFDYSIVDVIDAIEEHEKDGWMWILKPSRLDREDHHVVTQASQAESVLREGASLVEWVCQRYIQNPMLVQGRKFHLRVNVLAVGALQVFVHQPSVLVSTAALPYDPSPEAMGNKYIHISNAIYAKQYHGSSFDEAQFKFPLSRLQQEVGPGDYGEFAREEDGETVFDTDALMKQISTVVGELFEAASQDFNAFVPHENSFELFGLDFVLDESGTPYLLECNAGCDWESMFSVRYKYLLEKLFEDTLAIALAPSITEHGPALSAESKVSFSGFVVALDKQAFADGSAGMKWGEVAPPNASADATNNDENVSPSTSASTFANKPVTAEEAAALGVIPGTSSLRLWWAGSLYRASVRSIDVAEHTVRYRLLECLDDSDDDEYDSEEDPLDTGFLDRIEISES